jgi:hypothetical protein
MKIQELNQDGFYRASGKCDLEHNHEMTLSKHPSIPENIEVIVKSLLTVGVEKPPIFDVVDLSASHFPSRSELEA